MAARGAEPGASWAEGERDGDGASRGGERPAHATWLLSLSGNWQGHRADLPPPPATLLAQHAGRLLVRAEGLSGWDAGLASALWRSLRALQHPQLQIDLQGLPAGLRQIVELALPTPPAAGTTAATQQREMEAAAQDAPLTALGTRAHALLDRRAGTLAFFGEVLLAIGRLLRGRTDMRWSDLLWQLEQTGPRSLPIVALVSFLVGLIVAYMGAAQLVRFGAQTFIADLVTVGVVREIAALLVGIVLAGRVGAAFAAQIGSMRANEEIDALQTLGVDPVEHLVLPRVLALLVVGPLLTVLAAAVGMGVGWLVAVAIYGVTPLEYLYSSLQALTLPHLLVGLSKGTVYALLVALAGCHQGLAAGRSAQAVGDATTAAVVQSIVWMVVAASAMTVVFQRLDW